ncbi:hypothetical protein MANES_04G131400v8 [Manihot esculenta]|uniref:Uncharacterized protein n=1 Tax=Manihot esculenta TaxID=3983 RepID=A0ACB7HWB5_MANES|nr:hypothetical protein MANES_04G131400v8 [Manihot esculenta]
MLERVLSSRRVSPHPDDAVSDSDTSTVYGDESKTRKLVLSLLAANYLSRLSHVCPCPTPCLILCLLVLLVYIVSLLYHSRNFVCVSPFDPKNRVGFFGLDGLESDFGFLGVPWCRSKHGKTVEWTSKDLLKGLEEFVPIYETRPIKNNMYGGMGFDHSFGLWFIARWLKPELTIESGAFKGHSTWKYLKKGPAYVDGNCTYFAGKDFLDFESVEWKSVMKRHGFNDFSRVLIFFDDHQNELKRVKQALKAGVEHLVFEDNYDTGTGDHYSLRQICDQFYIRGGGHSCFRDGDESRIRSKWKKFWEKAVDIDELCGPNEAWWGIRSWMLDNFNHSNKLISYEEHFQNSQFIDSILDVYWELPPVAGPSLTHQTRYDPARTIPPIVEDGRYGLFQWLGLGRLETSVFNGYTQMVYLQISEQES